MRFRTPSPSAELCDSQARCQASPHTSLKGFLEGRRSGLSRQPRLSACWPMEIDQLGDHMYSYTEGSVRDGLYIIAVS